MHVHDRAPDSADKSAQEPAAKPGDGRAVRRRRFPRWVRWFLWALLLLLAITAAGLGVRHKIAVDRLAEATAAQDALDPGWKWEDIEAARAQVPEDENGALIVRDAVKQLPKEWPPEELRTLASNATDTPDVPLAPELRLRLRGELEAVAPALREARRLTDRPTGRFAVTYHIAPFLTQLTQHQEATAVALLLVLDALRLTEDGDYRAAARSCRAAFNAGRSLGDTPFTVPQLTRALCVQIACRTVERLLRWSQLSEDDLAELQRLVQDEMNHPGFLVSCRGERAAMHGTLVAMEDGEIYLDMEGRGRPTSKELVQTFFARDTLRLQHAEAFPMMNKMVEVAETPAHRRARPLQEFQAMTTARRKELPTILVPALGKVEANFTRRDAYLACLAAALAAERYRRDRGEWPPSLEALPPQFLSAVPLDPSDGQPVRYVRRDDGTVIYSAVADGKDQVFDPARPSPPGEGIAVRLWNPDRRGKSD
jgi:hypothetical protein